MVRLLVSSDDALNTPRALAMPKSATFTSPSRDKSTFCGLTSRCTTPSGRFASSRRRWAWSSPLATSAQTYTPVSMGSGAPVLRARPSRVARSGPFTYSIAM